MKQIVAGLLVMLLSTGNVLGGNVPALTLRDPAVKLVVPEYLLKKDLLKKGEQEARTGGSPLGAQIGASVLHSVLWWFSTPVYMGNVRRILAGK